MTRRFLWILPAIALAAFGVAGAFLPPWLANRLDLPEEVLSYRIVADRLFMSLTRSTNEQLAWRVDPDSNGLPHTSLDQRLVWGYCDRHSVGPGESFSLMVSADPVGQLQAGHLELVRVGWADPDHQVVWRSDPLEIPHHPLPASAAAYGAGWPEAARITAGTDWGSGYYSVDFVSASGQRDRDIAYIVVRPADGSPGDVVVQLPTNTYQAYNLWGGSSLYRSAYLGQRSHLVSFDRPTRSRYFDWEHYYLRWLEKLAQETGFTVHYVTDFDVHRDPRYARDYPVFITLGHDEYWTATQFQRIHDRIYEHGRNTLFLGGNSAYYQARYLEEDLGDGATAVGRLLSCVKEGPDPVARRRGDPTLATVVFRGSPKKPEMILRGTAYESYFEDEIAQPRVRHAYRVHPDASSFYLLKGTGLSAGDALADVIGYEWGNADPKKDGARLQGHLPEAERLPPADAIRVLFEGEPTRQSGAQGHAQAVFYRSQAGAKVFSASTVRWPWGLTRPGFQTEPMRRFNRNLILDFLADSKTGN